jgi:hypothetical protein
LLPASEIKAIKLHREAASKRSKRRVDARERSQSPYKGTTQEQRAAAMAADLDAAYEAALRGPEERRQGNPVSLTAHQRYLINKDTRLRESKERYGEKDPWAYHSPNAQQSAYDRIFNRGYVWPGSDVIAAETGDPEAGLVAGRYFQFRFVEKGFRTTAEPLLNRITAAVAAQNKGLMAGPRKDDRRRYPNKRSALDQVYLSTTGLLQIIRVDLDKWFPSYEDLYSKLQYLVETEVLPCFPHFVSWAFDDRFPGQLPNPHLLFLLPADRGVWAFKDIETTVATVDPKTGEATTKKITERVRVNNRQSRLFDAVAAGLTMACESIGADPGGLANVCDFKSPISTHCEYRVANRTLFPDLEEMAEVLDVSLDREGMARVMSVKRMIAAGMDPEASNRFWTWAKKSGFEVAHELYLEGVFDQDRDDFDIDKFVASIADILLKNIPDEIAPRNARERGKAKEAILARARFSAWNFDPKKLDGREINRGAASHLIKSDDDLHTRQSKGQWVGCRSKEAESKERITKAYRQAIENDTSRDIYDIAEVADRHPRTVLKYAGDAELTASVDALMNLDFGECDHRPIESQVSIVPEIVFCSVVEEFECREGDTDILRPSSINSYPTRTDGESDEEWVDQLHRWTDERSGPPASGLSAYQSWRRGRQDGPSTVEWQRSDDWSTTVLIANVSRSGVELID